MESCYTPPPSHGSKPLPPPPLLLLLLLLLLLGFRFDETLVQFGLPRGTCTGKGAIVEKSPFSVSGEDAATRSQTGQPAGGGGSGVMSGEEAGGAVSPAASPSAVMLGERPRAPTSLLQVGGAGARVVLG